MVCSISDEYDSYKIVGSVTPVGSVNNGDTRDLRKQMPNLTPLLLLTQWQEVWIFFAKKVELKINNKVP
jgi:hypothetical protein